MKKFNVALAFALGLLAVSSVECITIKNNTAERVRVVWTLSNKGANIANRQPWASIDTNDYAFILANSSITVDPMELSYPGHTKYVVKVQVSNAQTLKLLGTIEIPHVKAVTPDVEVEWMADGSWKLN